MLITQINVLGYFVNFCVIFRYIWEEKDFLKRVVKLREIRIIEDLAPLPVPSVSLLLLNNNK